LKNHIGYTRITFHNKEFLIEWNHYFLEDRRICRIRNEVYQIIVPKNSSNTVLYIGGWNQVNLTPKEISEFLSTVPNFPNVIGVVCPKDERTGRFNPFYCFVTINSENVERALKMKIYSGRKLLRISIARDRKPINSR